LAEIVRREYHLV